jgi:hypothetical protein
VTSVVLNNHINSNVKEVLRRADRAFSSISAVFQGGSKLPIYSALCLRTALYYLQHRMPSREKSATALVNSVFSHLIWDKADSRAAVLGSTVERSPEKSCRSVNSSPSNTKRSQTLYK